MKINSIDVTNFLKIRKLKIDFTDAPIHLVAGLNEVGKTSLQEALRFCLLGETQRVEKKSEYKAMITDGANHGEVSLSIAEIDGAVVRDIATGKGTADDYEIPIAMQYLLDATRYAWVDAKTRRSFMFNLLGVTINREIVQGRLMERGIPPSVAEYIMPFLRGGFEPAAREATAKTTEARGGWSALTGERHGALKGEDWKPKVESIDPNLLLAAERVVKDLETTYESAVQALGAAGTYPQGHRFPCPSCETMLLLDRGTVSIVTAGDAAADPQNDEVPALEEAVAEAKTALAAAREPLEALELQIKFNQKGDEIAEQAKEYHNQIAHWKLLADALAPDGIPGEIISDKLKPLNKRLMAAAMATDWPQVTVTPTLDIMVDGRPFGLQSESSQWRAQAAIAEAISAISGIGFLVLDRIDVLDIPNRGKLMKWLVSVAGDHSTIIAIGTLKEPPQTPPAIAVHWLEGGEEVKQKAA